MMSLIKFMYSENERTGKKPSTEAVRNVVLYRKKLYEKLKEKTDSPTTKKFYDLLIEELNDIERQTKEYDNIEHTLKDVRRNRF